MVLLIVIIIFLVLLLSVITFGIVNLIRQNELLEESLSYYQNKFIKIYNKIDETNEQLKDVDYKGAFKADDEVGFVFKNITDIMLDLEAFFVTVYDETNGTNET
jgi:predicted PurR-regulated permease PerM